LHQTSKIIFCGVDALIPPRGKASLGFDEFTAALDHGGIPAVWVTSRSRGQMDDPRRKLGHSHPFIAERGCGVYLPEGYFHLRPAKTVRLGRFTCIPIAEPQPAARDALDLLAEETGVSVVTLRSLSARQVMQNSGLPLQDADLARQHDFDELFFFAGATEQDIGRFVEEGRQRNLQLRQHGVLWSLASGANLGMCVRALSKLYERALRSHPSILGIATQEESVELFAACDRAILLGDHTSGGPNQPHSSRAREIPFPAPDTWDLVLASLASKG
jgi:predicted mannosyl-3-phosphoglycerate phosphatase (HAD superfamily)